MKAYEAFAIYLAKVQDVPLADTFSELVENLIPEAARNGLCEIIVENSTLRSSDIADLVDLGYRINISNKRFTKISWDLR